MTHVQSFIAHTKTTLALRSRAVEFVVLAPIVFYLAFRFAGAL